ncbi:MAG: allophanate hydrolase, partial [Gammaproteobacteria bacterium]|nr:allophanate hydrolase [Gammaproteobacteria bacterium]
GPEFELFTPESHDLLWGQSWQITPQSNRMGSRLKGRELQRKQLGDMLSSAVIPGTIQVPPSGQPIILMGDSQTTGGYPRIGVVIRADLWKLAQAPLNGRLRLVPVDATAAIEAWNARQRYLEQVAQALGAAGWSMPRHNASKGVPHAD